MVKRQHILLRRYIIASLCSLKKKNVRFQANAIPLSITKKETRNMTKLTAG